MITGLNSPLPGIKIESFRDLLCYQSLFETKNLKDFNLTQWVEKTNIGKRWENVSIVSYESQNCFRIWSPASAGRNFFHVKIPINELFHELYYNYLTEIRDMMELLQGGINAGLLPYSDKIMLSLLHPGLPLEPASLENIRIQEKRYPTENELAFSDEQEITNCEQKSAYITNSDLIESEIDFLSRYYAVKNMYSKKDDMICLKMEELEFLRVRQTKIPNLYRWMIDSGIYDRLEVEKNARKNRGREPLVKIQKEKERLEGVSSLSGGLITLFILCGGLISLAVMSFIFLECRVIILKLLVKCYATSSIAFEKCWIKVVKNRQCKVSKNFHHQKLFLKRNKIHVLYIKQ
jgi:hypothetical protein